jgi:hypothetical protein
MQHIMGKDISVGGGSTQTGEVKLDFSNLFSLGGDGRIVFLQNRSHCSIQSAKFKFFRSLLLGLLICLLGTVNAAGQTDINSGGMNIAIEWHHSQPRGTIEVLNGNLLSIEVVKGKGSVRGNSFVSKQSGAVRLDVALTNTQNSPGSDATIVTVRTSDHPFSFFLRDINNANPVYIPEYGVVVTATADLRSYEQIEASIQTRNLKTKLQVIENEPEESFDSASVYTRNQPCPTWLGISRDMHIFELSDNRTHPASEMNMIRPRYSSTPVRIPESGDKVIEFGYMVGRGQGVAINTVRRLEDGVLPILRSTMRDEDIEYYSTAFVSLEKSPLVSHQPMGTDFLVADQFSAGHMLTKEHEELLKSRLVSENGKTESTVLYYRNEATNRASVPRYAWFKTIRPGGGWWMKSPYSFDKVTGFSTFVSGNVFGISRLNGKPLHDEEIAILLQPNEKAVFEFFVPHTPLSKERAFEISKQSFDFRLAECKLFWQEKLAKAAQISVPEKRVNEMIQAGLLHLDLVTYGNDPAGALAPAIGVYSPIGTESSPIIQFYNSMGLPDIARRSLMYFLDKQHDDGMIQNFGGYMVETGAALWSMGEYFRYTKDKSWVQQVEPKLLKGCSFLIQWRNGNKKEELRDRGYGMIAGKVADPEDPFHQYMLNAYGYLGISRVAEMLAEINPDQSKRLRSEADAWRKDIRNSFTNSIARSPVVPLGDGRWSPTLPPWTEAIGPRALHIIPETYVSHGTVTAPDVLLGPLYLVFCEVLAPGEAVSRMMTDYHSELFYQRNAAFSQPYYSRHNWIQLKLGQVKPFLKTYYNTFSALADRETYSFWEHLYQVSVHKTHEEGWFLMETRWMLYLEEENRLRLLPGIPRRWLEDGKQITLKNVASYFGAVNLQVNSNLKQGTIVADISCLGKSKPGEVLIRLPHPEGKKAARVSGGIYDPVTESVLIREFTGTATIKAEF